MKTIHLALAVILFILVSYCEKETDFIQKDHLQNESTEQVKIDPSNAYDDPTEKQINRYQPKGTGTESPPREDNEDWIHGHPITPGYDVYAPVQHKQKVTLRTSHTRPSYVPENKVHRAPEGWSKCSSPQCLAVIRQVEANLAKLAAETCRPQGACILCCFENDLVYYTLLVNPPVECGKSTDELSNELSEFIDPDNFSIFQ